MCGETIKTTAKKCRHCGEFLDEDLRERREAEDDPGPDPALSMIVPIGATPLSIATSYLGLFGLLCLPLGPIALIAGIFALKEIKNDPRQKKGGSVRAIVGMILGGLGTVALVLVAIAMATGR
jgi:hypothetical protein